MLDKQGIEEDIWAFGGRSEIDCRTLHNEKRGDLCNILNVYELLKTRRLRWLGHVVLWGKTEMYTRF
jgi:hypothetical protein